MKCVKKWLYEFKRKRDRQKKMLQSREKKSYNKKMQEIKVNSAAQYFRKIFRWENKKTFLKKENKSTSLKKNEQKNNFEKDLKSKKKCVFFTTRIYRLLHNMTFMIDKKT